MEFEKNTPVTTEDISRSAIPHITIEPVHGSIKPTITDAPIIANDEAKRVFSFESESTADVAAVNTPRKRSHTLLVAIFAHVVVITIVAALFVYLHR